MCCVRVCVCACVLYVHILGSRGKERGHSIHCDCELWATANFYLFMFVQK